MPTLKFSSSERRSTFQCEFDGGVFACTSPLVPSPLADGPHTFSVTAIDASGNADPTPATRTFAVRRSVAPGRLLRTWAYEDRWTTVERLELEKLATGTTVLVTCRGRGCPFDARHPKAVDGRASLTRSFAHAHLRAGAIVTIELSAPNLAGKVFRIASGGRRTTR